MSNPLRAPVKTLTDVQRELASGIPDVYVDQVLSPEQRKAWDRYNAEGKGIETALSKLKALDMDIAPTVILPRELIGDEEVRKRKSTMAVTQTDVLVLRKRTRQGKTLANVFYQHIPNSIKACFSKSAVVKYNAGRVFASGGTQYALGRLEKAYPKFTGTKGLLVPTASEVKAAIRNCGIDIAPLPDEFKSPLPLNPVWGSDPEPATGDDTIRLNAHADNGFPVGGNMTKPECADKVLSLAADIRKATEQAYAAGGPEGVWELVRMLEQNKPHLVAVKGKAKADMYTIDKLARQQMRFYNVFGRQVVLNMQMSTQRLEFLKKHILYGGNSAIGLPLVRLGADKLVAEMDKRMALDGYAYVHLGDDSWVALRAPAGGVILFSLDASNFDLTQHSRITEPVHLALRNELMLIDGPSASLWHALARRRLIVVSGGVTRVMKHAGPSGMPLQSTVNDVLMEILLARIVRAWPKAEEPGTFDVLENDEVSTLIMSEGTKMGFDVRLEEMVVGSGTIRQVLAEQPFLFIGYRFYTRADSKVAVFSDLPRCLTQMQYPGVMWMDKSDIAALEAVRLSSIVLSMGVPPDALRESFEYGRREALLLLERAGEIPKSVADRLEWFMREGAFAGTELEATLAGLMGALQRDPEVLWLQQEKSRAEQRAENPYGWADLVEEEEKQVAEVTGLRLIRPKRGPEPKATIITFPQYPLAHPATSRNDGRPPPTARWAPDRPPREVTRYEDQRPTRRGTKGRRHQGVLSEGDSESLYSEAITDDDGLEMWYPDEDRYE